MKPRSVLFLSCMSSKSSEVVTNLASPVNTLLCPFDIGKSAMCTVQLQLLLMPKSGSSWWLCTKECCSAGITAWEACVQGPCQGHCIMKSLCWAWDKKGHAPSGSQLCSRSEDTINFKDRRILGRSSPCMHWELRVWCQFHFPNQKPCCVRLRNNL